MKFTDMIGRNINLSFPPVRIVSLVPSKTELLYDLGLDEEVVGITKFCVHPNSWFRSKQRVGGTKQLNIDKIRSLQPDLIIANKEENEKHQVDLLSEEFPVWTSDISTLDDALSMIRNVGQITDRPLQAEKLIKEIEIELQNHAHHTRPIMKAAYFIWYKPWMTVGRDTFISNMMETIGMDNIFKDKTRYPEVDLAELQARQPDVVLLSSEPFPFKEKHAAELRAAIPTADIRLVNGEMFSWYGSRMRKAIPYLATLKTIQ